GRTGAETSRRSGVGGRRIPQLLLNPVGPSDLQIVEALRSGRQRLGHAEDGLGLGQPTVPDLEAQVRIDGWAEADRLVRRPQEEVPDNCSVMGHARRTRDRAAQAQGASDLGYFYERLGRYPEAISRYQDSLIIRRELGDRYGEALSLNGLGVVYWRLGRYPE